MNFLNLKVKSTKLNFKLKKIVSAYCDSKGMSGDIHHAPLQTTAHKEHRRFIEQTLFEKIETVFLIELYVCG
jgi:hypothetical protein